MSTTDLINNLKDNGFNATAAIQEAGKGLGIDKIAAGATSGASIGSIIPGLGTAIGAGVGAVVGTISQLFTGKPRLTWEEANQVAEKVSANYVTELAKIFTPAQLTVIGKNVAEQTIAWIMQYPYASQTTRRTYAADFKAWQNTNKEILTGTEFLRVSVWYAVHIALSTGDAGDITGRTPQAVGAITSMITGLPANVQNDLALAGTIGTTTTGAKGTDPGATAPTGTMETAKTFIDEYKYYILAGLAIAVAIYFYTKKGKA